MKKKLLTNPIPIVERNKKIREKDIKFKLDIHFNSTDPNINVLKKIRRQKNRVTRVIRIRINIENENLNEAIVSITIHFGKNPKKGGNPPSERSLRAIEIFKIGEYG